MSIYLMSEVWRLDLPRHMLFFLLTLADHASDDGSNVYPSIRFLSWKTGYSERQIQRLIKIFVRDGVLNIIVDATHNFPNQYQINLKSCRKKPPFDRGDKMSPPQRGDKLKSQGVTNKAKRGDVIMSPKPPSETSSKTPPLQDVEIGKNDDLIMPTEFSPVLKSEIIQKVMSVKIEDKQQLIDELAGRMAIANVRNPIGYLSAMVKNYLAGEFIPELAHQVRINRETLQKRDVIKAKAEDQLMSEMKQSKSNPTTDFKELLKEMKRNNSK